MNAVSATLSKIWSREPERGRLLDQELVAWTKSVRELLRRTDTLLERLESLNLTGEARPPRDLEEVARDLLQPAGSGTRRRTVQELLDGVLDAQEPILSELRACRTERLLRSGGASRGVDAEGAA